MGRGQSDEFLTLQILVIFTYFKNKIEEDNVLGTKFMVDYTIDL